MTQADRVLSTPPLNAPKISKERMRQLARQQRQAAADDASLHHYRSGESTKSRPRSSGKVCCGSWPCKNGLPRKVDEKPGPVRSQATIAAMSGLVPTMFITLVRL
jgi:hypothetical protein